MQTSRRSEPRFAVTAQAAITAMGELHFGTVVNISASGVMVHLPVQPRFDAATVVDVSFFRVSGRGTVRHVSRAEDGVFVGIELNGGPEYSNTGSVAEIVRQLD